MSMYTQPWARVNTFRFLTRHYDPRTGEAVFGYSFDAGAPLFERLVFPHSPWPSDASRQVAFDRALSLLHLVMGVSYYKACVPARMDTGDLHLDEHLAGFMETLYIKGLAEFAYTNGIELESRVNFPVSTPVSIEPASLGLPERALVAMGGGKDSLVSLEILREAGVEVQPVCVGQSRLIADTVKAARLPLIQIARNLSPSLAEMNQAGALNGHVPVTAINSAILVCAAILYGYRYVVFSNESSAEEATLNDANGKPVNHQFSKSLEFESAFRDVVKCRVSPDIEYFSLLRPLKELAIAKRFSELQQYFDTFSSCNRNFHSAGPEISGRWCGSCPKCRFTTLALAPFVSPDTLAKIMGADLLDQPEQEDGFRALCRLRVEKPFECVGTVDESRAAMLALADLPGWRDKSVVRALQPELSGLKVPALHDLLSSRGPHCIPDAGILNALG